MYKMSNECEVRRSLVVIILSGPHLQGPESMMQLMT